MSDLRQSRGPDSADPASDPSRAPDPVARTGSAPAAAESPAGVDTALGDIFGDAAGRAWLGELGDDPPLRLYLALLRVREPTAASVADLGLPGDEAQRALHVLERHGMVASGTGGSLRVTPPDVAVPAYLTALELRLRSTRTVTPRLTQLYRQVQEEPAGTARRPPTLRLLTGLAEVDAACRRLTEEATHGIDVLASPENWEWAVSDLTTASDRLTRRAVLDESLLADEEALNQILGLRESGVEVRIALKVPVTLHLFDEQVVLLRIDDGPDPRAVTGFEVRHRRLTEALGRVFWLTHEHADPVPLARTSAHERSLDREARVLTLLATGATDSVIARRMGISQRTVERYVHNLMDSLGATTRFQAGVQAVRRGLLSAGSSHRR